MKHSQCRRIITSYSTAPSLLCSVQQQNSLHPVTKQWTPTATRGARPGRKNKVGTQWASPFKHETSKGEVNSTMSPGISSPGATGVWPVKSRWRTLGSLLLKRCCWLTRMQIAPHVDKSRVLVTTSEGLILQKPLDLRIQCPGGADMLFELASWGIPSTTALPAMGSTTLLAARPRTESSAHLSLHSSEHATSMPRAPPCPPGHFLHVLEENSSLLILIILPSPPMRLLLLPALLHPHRANDTRHGICSCLCPAKLRVLYYRTTLVSFISPVPDTTDDGLMEEWMNRQTSTVQFPALNLRGGDVGQLRYALMFPWLFTNTAIWTDKSIPFLT